MYNLATLLQEEGFLDEAKKWYLKAMEHKYVEMGSILNNLGAIEYSRSNYSMAEEYWLQAFDHGKSEALMNIGCAKQVLGQFDDAESFYTKALNTPTRLIAMQNLSTLEHIKENIDQAKLWLRQILQEEELPNILYLLANLEFKTGHLDDAEKLATEAVEQGEAQGLLLLALTYWRKNDFQQAKSFYQKAIALNVKDAEVFYIQFLEKIGELEHAQQLEDDYLESLSPEEIIPEEKTVITPALQPTIPQPMPTPSVQEQLYEPLPTPVDSFKAPLPSKKYVKYLARAQKRLEEEQKKPVMTQESSSQSYKTFKDISITLHPDLNMETLTDHEKIMLQKCLTALATAEHKRSRYEPLTGYENVHSMRLTHEDRLVFRILEGSLHKGVTKIEIFSLKGHYEKDNHKAFKDLITSKVPFIPWAWAE